MLPGPLQDNTQTRVKGIYGITPVFNEEGSLPGMCKSVIGWWAGGKYGKQLIRWYFVDDGSSDNSLNILKDFAAKYPVIQYISLKENRGKGWAYKAAAEEIAEFDKDVNDKIICQLDADVLGVRAQDIDGLIKALLEEQPAGMYTGTRVASMALVPSPHKEGLRKWAREKLGAFTARGAIAITGQRAYYGSTMAAVAPRIKGDTRFGLEAMLNAEIVETTKKIQKQYGLNERQRHELIHITRWRNITHVPYKEKVQLNNGRLIENPHVNKALVWFNCVPHYARMGFDTATGAIRGRLAVKIKWFSKRKHASVKETG